MVNLLLNDGLVCRVIGIQHLDCLPPSLAFRCVGTLNRKTGQQRRQRSTLGIHTGLDEFLGAAQVGVAVDHCPRAGHGGNPEAEEEWVAVLGRPFLGALKGGLVLLEQGCAVAFALDFGLLFRVVLDVVLCGGAVGGDDGCSQIKIEWDIAKKCAATYRRMFLRM